jgi:hypothetical protein
MSAIKKTTFLRCSKPNTPTIRPTFTLGVRANVQPKSSIPIAAQVEIGPKGFTLGIEADIEKPFQSAPNYYDICPQILININNEYEYVFVNILTSMI